jgi:thioredoxin 1
MGWIKKILGISETPHVQPVSVNDDNFAAEVRKSEIPVLLDVWGPSCAPCKQLEPIIMNLASKYEGRVKVCEMNAAASPRTMAKLGVRGTPTVIYFNKANEVERVVGFRGQRYHEDTLAELFGVGATQQAAAG